MKKIICNSKTHGVHEILLDDEDHESISKFTWSIVKKGSIFYAERTQWNPRKRFLMHRVILGIDDSKILIDHEDTNGLNNQKYNLRIASKSHNAMNTKGHSDRLYSKFKGVTFDVNRNKWKAHIRGGSPSLNINLGRFNSEEEAAVAYNKKAIELHGEFANLNKI